ncbi:hypothetical protein VTK73DRAFT_1746 [Phialemonium thermophilum]|uniref:Uncharacterized protein n=1 Tax=Phialemonium thermophilum TaxID=223376 RepID=A0ABR3X8J7_9PEZI
MLLPDSSPPGRSKTGRGTDKRMSRWIHSALRGRRSSISASFVLYFPALVKPAGCRSIGIKFLVGGHTISLFFCIHSACVFAIVCVGIHDCVRYPYCLLFLS